MNDVIILLAVMGGVAAVLMAADYGLFGAKAKDLAVRVRHWWSL
jgi:hypothetical protein